MSTPKFAKTHNLVAFLEKPKESNGFEGIIDFLNASSIRYALTVNPTMYTSCIKQLWATAKVKTVNGEVQIQALVDGKKVIVTETSIRRALHLKDAEETDCLPTATIFTKLERIGYEKLTQKLTFYKAFFSPQWKFLIHTILQCLSAKTTAWNEFSRTMASTIICLTTNQNFNFSKYIFDNMVKNLEGGVKFLMYPRFVQVFLDKQVEGMSTHKEFYATPSHTKKVFANMKREGKGFSSRDTPLFPTMMVKAQQEEGEGLVIPTDPHPTPFITQPSLSQSQQKQKPRRKQRKGTEIPSSSGEPIADKAANEEHIPTHSNDPLLSGKDRLQLNELMEICTNLQKKEDASKQERKIADIDADAKEIEVEKVVSTAEVTTASATTTTVDELTLAQTLIEIKAAKPKAVTNAATTITPASTRPKAKGIIFHDQEEQAPASTPIVSPSQLPHAKDKGKAKMIEEEPIKKFSKKEQIRLDEEFAFKIQAGEQEE
ncbi:hypothetical protein Tco_0874138 [Tanacetum coccineum]|uniref:Uncharacterized protein n=1 Tax=Tanacetum coccineum TaxID=301880 RepID=A0ABQ5BNQ4_9ASTR